MSGSLRNWIKVRFIAGFFVTVPAIASAWLLYVFWDAIDTFFSPVNEADLRAPDSWPGFLTAVVLVLVMGTIATNVVGRRLLARIELLFIPRAHLSQHLSVDSKQLIESFSPEKRQSFKAVVLAEHPREGEFVFGLRHLRGGGGDAGGEAPRWSPSSCPPTFFYLGDVIVLPRKDIITTGLTVEEGIRIILSAGTATRPDCRGSGSRAAHLRSHRSTAGRAGIELAEEEVLGALYDVHLRGQPIPQSP
jgi:uncharacterized membrane protein